MRVTMPRPVTARARIGRVRAGLLLHPGVELYDLRIDPLEQANLSRSGRDASIRRRLAAVPERWADASGRRAGARSVRTEDGISPRLREQLRGLGYLR